MRGKVFRLFTMAIAAIGLGVCFTACVKDENSNPDLPNGETVSITLGVERLDLTVNDTYTIETTVSDSDAEVVWSSSNAEVATVEAGVVRALSEGETIVTAMVEGTEIKDECVVTVRGRYVPTLTLRETDLTLDVNATYQIEAAVSYGGETVNPTDGITYESTDEEKITVSESGLIRVLSAGEASVIVRAEYAGEKVGAEILVKGKNVLRAALTSVEQKNFLSVSAREGEDHAEELFLTVKYNSETITNAEAEGVHWTVEDNRVAALSVTDGKAYATGKKYGQTKITATYTVNGESVSASIDVSVYNPAIEGEINSFIDPSRIIKKASAEVTGLNAYSTASVSYYEGALDGRMPYGNGFLKATHHVPDGSVTDPGSRGENLTVNILSENALRDLKKAGYTKVVVPLYLDADFAGTETCSLWYVLLAPGNWVDNMGIDANMWYHFVYDIDTAISLYGDNGISVSITNYSGNYNDKMNVDIDVYFDGIFAVKEVAELGIDYNGKTLDEAKMLKGQTFEMDKLSVTGLASGMEYVAYLTTPNGKTALLTEDFLMNTEGVYTIKIVPTVSDNGTYYVGTSSFTVQDSTVVAEENEINSFANIAYFNNKVHASVSGLNAYSSATVEYYEGAVGGKTGGFVKATHIVPDSSVTDMGSRGERLQVTVNSLNSLKSLKEQGYTKIIVPMYLTCEGNVKPESWRVMGKGDWWTYIVLQENTWTNFEYDINTAVTHFNDSVLMFEVNNYSSEYPNKLNANISFYLGGIYATGKPEAPSVEVTAEENEINSFKTEEYFEGRVNASVTGLNGSSTASVSYYTGTVGGVTGNFAKATHHVPDSNVTDAGSRGENLTVDILSLNNLQELYDAGYRTIVIPVYLEAEFAGEPTCTTWYVLREPGDWVENAEISNGVWVNYTYSLDAALWYTSQDGHNEVSISITNWSGHYSNGRNVNINVYIGGIYAA